MDIDNAALDEYLLWADTKGYDWASFLAGYLSGADYLMRQFERCLPKLGSTSP